VIGTSVAEVALDLAVNHIDRARRMLDWTGASAIPAARLHLEAAAVELGEIAAAEDADPDIRLAAERCRATLSSHLLAADNLEAVGFGPAAVLEMLVRGAAAGVEETAATAAMPAPSGR
jgi:hypothetical protein